MGRFLQMRNPASCNEMKQRVHTDTLLPVQARSQAANGFNVLPGKCKCKRALAVGAAEQTFCINQRLFFHAAINCFRARLRMCP
jgi:hypothetical protein